MARVDLVHPGAAPEAVERLFETIAEDRGLVPNAYRMLGHSPMALARMYEFFKAFWQESDIEPLLRETVILRVAQLLACDYEWGRHRSLAREVGVTDDKVRALGAWPENPMFSASERAALAVVDSATKGVSASEQEIAGLKAHFSDRQIVELLALIGLYGMMARLLLSLEVELEPGVVGLAELES